MVMLFRPPKGVTLPSSDGSSYAFSDKTRTYFPVSWEAKGASVKAQAGIFAFEAAMAVDRRFVFFPLSAELQTSLALSLSLGAEAKARGAGFSIDWKPGTPSKLKTAGAALGALTAPIAVITPFAALANPFTDKDKEATKRVMDMAAFAALIATSGALLAKQKDITLDLTLPPVPSVNLFPLFTVSKLEGQKAEFTCLATEGNGYKWQNCPAFVSAVTARIRNRGTRTANTGINVNAVASQMRTSVQENNG